VANKFTIFTQFKAQDQMTRTVKRMDKAMGSFNRTLGVIKTALVGGIVYRVGKGFVDAAADVEKYKTTLTTMLGSVEAANKRFDEMSRFAAKTPFELGEVVELGNQLQALGRYSVENMTLLGDMAAAAGKPVDQATRAFAKLASGQKGIAVDMFRDLLISTDDWIKATGKGITKSGSLMATTEEMIAALPKILSAKGFSGMMAQQSKTWNGFVSNMQDSFTRIKAGLGEALLDPLKDVGAMILQVSDRVLAWVNANKELIATRFRQFLDGVKKTLKVIGVLWKSGVIPAILAGVAAFKIATFAVQLWTTAQAMLNAVMAANPITLIIIGIAALVAVIVLLIKNWDKVKAAAVNAFRKIKDAIFSALDNPIVRAIATILAPFITIPLLIIKNWDKVRETILNVWARIKEPFQKIGDFFSNVFGRDKTAAAAGGTPMSPNSGLIESRRIEEQRSTVDMYFHNPPAGTRIRQRGTAPGVNLRLGTAGNHPG